MARRTAGEWDGARTAFEKAEKYNDATEQIKETSYQEAANAYIAGEYDKSYSIYCRIKSYKDVETLLETDDNLAAAAHDAKIAPYKEVGNIVTFGTYPQTKEGKDQTSVEWIVLDYDESNHKALLLSKYGMNAVSYNKKDAKITWEQCTLREWLNDTFLNKAFTTDEQSAILITNVDNSSEQCYTGWNTSGGNNTQDRIFLLSYAEANLYLGVKHPNKDISNNIKSRVAPTAYAIAMGAYTRDSYQTAYGDLAGYWWLRSPGHDGRNAARVGSDGLLNDIIVIHDADVVRPAFWLNLESDIF